MSYKGIQKAFNGCEKLFPLPLAFHRGFLHTSLLLVSIILSSVQMRQIYSLRGPNRSHSRVLGLLSEIRSQFRFLEAE